MPSQNQLNCTLTKQIYREAVFARPALRFSGGKKIIKHVYTVLLTVMSRLKKKKKNAMQSSDENTDNKTENILHLGMRMKTTN